MKAIRFEVTYSLPDSVDEGDLVALSGMLAECGLTLLVRDGDPERAGHHTPIKVERKFVIPNRERYAWKPHNLKCRFPTWEEEVSVAISRGFVLVPPDVLIVPASPVYTMRADGDLGMLAWKSKRGLFAGKFGYPLFYKIHDDDRKAEA